MATVQRFEDLHVWQDARALVLEIYRITKQKSFRQDFALRDQIIRAAVSAMSNIAEGFERGTRREFIQSLNVSNASNGEVRSQLYVALDQEYLDEKRSYSMLESAKALSRRLAKLIDYLREFPSNARCRSDRQSKNESSTCNLQPSTFNSQK